jgi:hypothetical protein
VLGGLRGSRLGRLGAAGESAGLGGAGGRTEAAAEPMERIASGTTWSRLTTAPVAEVPGHPAATAVATGVLLSRVELERLVARARSSLH